MTSSWVRALACTSSMAAPATVICSALAALPPAARQPQYAKAGRRRLPPLNDARAASNKGTRSPPTAVSSTCLVSMNSVSVWEMARLKSSGMGSSSGTGGDVTVVDTMRAYPAGVSRLGLVVHPQPTRLPGRPPTIRELIAANERTVSFEFFPPKDDEGEAQLWRAIRELEPLRPTFVSVTYGAGGSTRDRTVRITERIASETTLTPVAHLTCVGHSRDELRGIVGRYADAGVRNVLALRGDPPGGVSEPWVPHPDGLDHAVELVELVRRLGDFSVGVACFPEGHPEAADLDSDAAVLVQKAAAGADFAVTQLFFDADDYVALVERVRRLGCDLPIIAGIMPITGLAQISRFAELSGTRVPARVVSRLERLNDPADVRREGVAVATELCDELLRRGAPGLHFYTLNRSKASREIYAGLAALS
jgi:methylenetetrahydrofolate reductase (NADPH)